MTVNKALFPLVHYDTREFFLFVPPRYDDHNWKNLTENPRSQDTDLGDRSSDSVYADYTIRYSNVFTYSERKFYVL